MIFFKRKELTPEEEAEEILEENYVYHKFDLDSTAVWDDVKRNLTGYPIISNSDPTNPNCNTYYIFDKTGEKIDTIEFTREEIIEEIISSKFDWIKTVRKLIKISEKRIEEEEINEEVEKIKLREQKRKVREKAEKKLYGKKKTIRKSMPLNEKEMILSKFNNQCAVCIQTEGLHIHHKDHNPSNNKMENLVVLCGVCHKKTHMKVR